MQENTNQTIVIKLPPTFKEETMQEMLNSLLYVDLERKVNCKPFRHVKFDINDLSRVGVAGITIFANIIELLKKKNIKYYFECSSGNICSRLLYSGFAEKYIQQNLKSKIHVDAIPLSIIQRDRVEQSLSYEIMPWFARCLEQNTNIKDIDQRKLGTIKTSLQEIFNNINDHSQEHIGCFFGFFDRNTQSIRLCVSDFGIGIPNNVNKTIIKKRSDAATIAKACEKNYTTKSKPNNAGMGLYIVLTNTVETNGGVLEIYSNSGYYKADKKDSKINYSLKNLEFYYPGTLIILEFFIDKIIFDDISDDFNWDDELWTM